MTGADGTRTAASDSGDLADEVAASVSAESITAVDGAVGNTHDEPAGGLSALRPIGVASAWVMLVCGVLGMLASATLTLERLELYVDSSYTPSCNINPVLSCGSVMVTEQAKFFGFPNPLLGLPAFAIILVTAVLSVGRVRLPRWYWTLQTAGAGLGFLFVNYLAFQSIYRIGALCPYCMVVWTVVPIILVLSLSRALGDGPRTRLIRDAGWVLLALWYAIIVFCAGERFWYYWSTLL